MRGHARRRAFLRTLIFSIALPGAALPGAAADEQPTTKAGGPQVQIFIENDVFDSTDRHYTSGLKIGGGIDGRSLPREVRDVYRGLLSIPPWKEAEEVYFGLFLGQSMYTPRVITIAAPQPFDRPWAGWLYLGLVGQRVSRGTGAASNPDLLDTLEIDAGVVGPASGAEGLQTWWHEQINSPRPEGWGNQLQNEPAFLVGYLHKRRYGRGDDGFDVIPHLGGAIGTVATFARAGGIVRYGHNKTGFGPDVIEPGGALLQSTRRKYESGRLDQLEWFVFGGVDVRYVAYNVFLDGTVFRDSPSVDRRPLVYDVLAGISVRLGIFRASLTRVERSEEFTAGGRGGGRQRFHSINLGLEF